MKTKNILKSGLLAITAAIILTSCYKNKNNYSNGSTNDYTISMKNSAFSPASLTVIAGSKIIWKNDDTMIHSVTTADGSINSGDIAVGSSYSKTFTAADTFNYYDANNSSMTGVIVVTASSAGGY